MPNRTKAIVCAAIFFPAALLASLIVGAIFKTINPSDLDITQGLAYLGHALISALVVGLSLAIASFVFAWKTHKQEGKDAAKLPFVVLAINVILVVLIMITNAYTLNVQDQYLIDHGRPTLDQYFDALEAQKQQ